MKNLLLLFTPLLLLFACQNTPKNTSEHTPKQEIPVDTIAFFEDFKEKERCINQNKDTLCAKGSALVINIENGPNDTATGKIRAQLQKEISGDSINISEYLDNFILGVDYYLEEENEYWPPYYAIDVVQDVALNNRFLLTGTTHQHTEEGGAHGNYFSQNFNFDIKTGENLDWRDLFVDSLQVYKLAEKTLQTELQKEEDIEISLYEFYDFPEDRFYLPDNFLIDEHSFSFLYTVYEIGPYVQGETEIVLPFQEIKFLVKEEAVLADYLKTIEF